jgi:hypothetical protein
MVSDEVPSDVSYQATVLADALRHIPRSATNRYVQMSEARWHGQVLAEETLPILYNDVLHMSLCAPISEVDREMANIFSKTIVQRCMTRMMQSVVLAMFDVKTRRNARTKTDEIVYDGRRLDSMSKHILLASLLGNFRHCKASTRPTGATRELLYKMVFSNFGDQWSRNWLRFCAHLFVFAIRDYLVHAIQEHPSMLHHFNRFINFDSFASCTQYAMDEARQMLHVRNDLLRASLDVESQSNQELYSIVSSKIGYWHDKMLKLSYQRCETSITAGLSAIRKVVPLTAVTTASGVAGSSPVDNVEEDEVNDVIMSALSKANNLSNYFVASPTTELHNDAPTGTEVGGALLHHIRQYLTPQQLEALQTVVQRAALLRTNTFQNCIDYFVFLGVHPNNVHFAKLVINAMHCGTINKDLQLKMFQKLHSYSVHCYTLVHLTAELLREAKSMAIVRTLPHYIRENQIKALQEKWGLTQQRVLIESTTVFQYCAVCGHVYSVLAEFRSQYTQNYQVSSMRTIAAWKF